MGGRQEWSSEDQRDIVILGFPESLLHVPPSNHHNSSFPLSWADFRILFLIRLCSFVQSESPSHEFGQRFLHSLSSIRVRRVSVIALVESWPCCSVLSSRLIGCTKKNCVSKAYSKEFAFFLELDRHLLYKQVFNTPYSIDLNTPYGSAEGQYIVLSLRYTLYCLEE
ncbi:hypothetical protein Tco_0201523 [Tanacetum coccineum]